MVVRRNTEKATLTVRELSRVVNSRRAKPRDPIRSAVRLEDDPSRNGSHVAETT